MLNQLFIISIFLLTIMSFGLGLFSIYRNPKSMVTTLWFLFNFSIGIWSINFLLMLLSTDKSKAILYSQLLYVGASLIPILFYHFTLSFLLELEVFFKKIFLIVGYILAAVFIFLSFTPLMIVGASPKFGFPFWLEVGFLHSILLIYFWVYVLLTIIFLYQGYKRSDGVRRKKFFYVFIAAIIGFASGGTSFLPHTLGIYPFGGFITWIYVPIITYGIFIDEIKIKIRF